MPDQFVVVNFPEARTVYSGGNPVGPTNQYLVINAGTHTFTLADPPNYTPTSQQIVVAGTSVVDPMEITFALSSAAPAPQIDPPRAADAEDNQDSLPPGA